MAFIGRKETLVSNLRYITLTLGSGTLHLTIGVLENLFLEHGSFQLLIRDQIHIWEARIRGSRRVGTMMGTGTLCEE